MSPSTLMARLLFLTSLMSSLSVAGGLVVVANAESGVDRLSREQVTDIFLGRYRQLPSGITAQPVDLPANHPLKALFYRNLVDKDLAQINAYWARLIFSGKTAPPRQSASVAEARDWLLHNQGGLGYMERESVGNRLRIVLELTP